MAGLPLNNFRTITKVVTTTSQLLYTAPLGFKSVFLLAQVTNTNVAATRNVTFLFGRDGVETEIVSDYPIPKKDTLNLLTGKLVLETNDYIKIIGSSNNDMKFIASILETSA